MRDRGGRTKSRPPKESQTFFFLVIPAMQPRECPPSNGGFSNSRLWDMPSLVGMMGDGDKRNLDVGEKKRTQRRKTEFRELWREASLKISHKSVLRELRCSCVRGRWPSEKQKRLRLDLLKKMLPISPTVPSDWRVKARRGNRCREEKTEHGCLSSKFLEPKVQPAVEEKKALRYNTGISKWIGSSYRN